MRMGPTTLSTKNVEFGSGVSGGTLVVDGARSKAQSSLFIQSFLPSEGADTKIYSSPVPFDFVPQLCICSPN